MAKLDPETLPTSNLAVTSSRHFNCRSTGNRLKSSPPKLCSNCTVAQRSQTNSKKFIRL